MIHNSSQLKDIAWGRMGPGERSAIVTANAFRDVGIETVTVSKKLFDNTQKMLFSASTNKDAKDVSRTMSAFFFSSYRDLDENVESVSRIWRRYFREAVSRVASV
jgi:N-glycosylase/DNA lyase